MLFGCRRGFTDSGQQILESLDKQALYIHCASGSCQPEQVLFCPRSPQPGGGMLEPRPSCNTPGRGLSPSSVEMRLQAGSRCVHDRLLSQRNGLWSGRISPDRFRESCLPRGLCLCLRGQARLLVCANIAAGASMGAIHKTPFTAITKPQNQSPVFTPINKHAWRAS